MGTRPAWTKEDDEALRRVRVEEEMSAIGDELRTKATKMCAPNSSIGPTAPSYFRDLADRIDAEMVEWPLGADKKPIKPSQTVYKAINGDDGEYVVHSLRRSVPGWVALIKRVGTDSSCIVRPDVLTHERPDSWERIADDIETFGNEADIDDATVEFLAKIEERIYAIQEEKR